MAYDYKSTPVLSKVKIGNQVYYLKDAEARKAIDSILADYLKSGDKTELLNKITALDGRVSVIEGDYLKAADKTDLSTAIENEAKRAKDAEGVLSGRIDDLEKGVIKIKSGEKVLAQDGSTKELSTTLSINYDSESRKVQLKGINNALVSEFDASAFIKDGMLWGEKAFVASGTSETVSITKGTITQSHKFEGLTKGHQYLAFCFTDGAVPTPNYNWEIVDLQDLVDVYTGGNGIDITDNVVSIKKDSSSEEFLTVGEDGLKLSGVQDAIDSGVGVAEGYTDTAIATEVTNRNAAIKVESDRALAAEGVLDGKIDDVADDLASEVTRATGVEEGLDGRLTTAEGNISSLQTKVTTIEEKPAYDITTAQINEWDANKGLIEAEVTRAKAAEEAAEANAEAYTDQEVSKEEVRAKAAEKVNSDAIAVLNGNATTEGSVAYAVAAEATLRKAADDNLQGQINEISGDIDGKIDAKIAELDGGADIATVANGQVSFKKVSEVDGIVSNGADISGAVVYTTTKTDSLISTAKGEAISDAHSYTDTKVSAEATARETADTRIEGKVDGLTSDFNNHTHSVSGTSTFTPSLEKSEKKLGVTTTNSEQFVKSVGSTQKYMKLAEYVNSVAADPQSFGNLTAVVGDGTDNECLVFTTSTISFDALGNVGKANAATGSLGDTQTGAGDAVIYSIDDTSKGTALATVTLDGNAASGVAYVQSVAGKSQTVNVSGTAAKVGE